MLVIDVMDAEPVHPANFPEPSIWPFLAAIATTVMLIGSIFTPWAVVWGSIPVTLTLVGWLWPRPSALNDETHPVDKARPHLEEATGPA